LYKRKKTNFQYDLKAAEALLKEDDKNKARGFDFIILFSASYKQCEETMTDGARQTRRKRSWSPEFRTGVVELLS
jgi:hypothetical protein